MNSVRDFFAIFWKYWQAFGRFIGDMVGRVFLVAFFLTIALPFGIGAALFTDPMHIRPKDMTHGWRERQTSDIDLNAGLNQF